MQTFIKTVIERLKSPLEPKRFCACSASLVVASLVCVATLNWTVNPYGQYSSNCFEPIVQDSRCEKVELFERLEAAPQGLILGSSRALKFEPEYLQTRTSQTFFNFAVNHGRPEDFLATVRYYRDRFGFCPKTVLIGVDVASLNDVIPNAIGSLLFCWMAPNTWNYQLRLSLGTALVLSALLVVCILRFDAESPFLYFQF